MTATTRTTRRKKGLTQSGFSMMQLLVTLAVVSIVSGLAVFGIASARQRIRLTNSSRMIASFAEKARVDSVRRHPTDPDQMASIEVLDKTTYRVKMDFDGDGVMEVRDFKLDDGVEFASDPIALAFDWRGRLIDLPATEIKISIVMQWGDDEDDQRWVDITRSGDVTIDSDVYLDDVPNVNPIANLSGIDSGSTTNGNNNPDPTPSPTPEPTPSPSPSPAQEVGPSPTPTPSPGADPTPSPGASPTPTASPSASPAASPGVSPSPSPSPPTCSISVTSNPNPFQISKRGVGSVSFIVSPSGTVDFEEGPSNLDVTRVAGNTFRVESLNNARGSFTLVFDTPCGTRNVNVTIVN
jgi:hypothetical protein